MTMKARIPVAASLSLISLLGVCIPEAFADNPIIQTKFTADPAPLVYDDTVYLYTSHDEDNASGFTMYNYMLYTSTDMVNWTDHGILAGVKDPYKTWKWADGSNAWAPQVIFRNNKFYMYAPFPKGGRMMIGVAVADKPTGPFVDAIGGPLIDSTISNGNDIDPTVLIDDDGQAYLYWGRQGVYYVKLKEDMISYSGSIVSLGRPQTMEEGPWLFKQDKFYYLAWASTCCPEGIGYAMSDKPTGPWTFKGSIMDGDSRSSGNHPGIMQYKGTWYVFGFNYAISYPQSTTQPLPGGHTERRSVCVEQLTYAADGTIPKIPWWTTTGALQIGTLNPYVQTEAETIAFSKGLKTETCGEGGMDVTDINNGEYIEVKGVDFGGGATSLDVRVASAGTGGGIEVRLDSQTGTLVGTCAISSTGGAQTWATKTCPVTGASGVHDLFFVFTGGSGSLFNFNWWKFIGSPSSPFDGGAAAGGQSGNDAATPTGGTTGTGAGGTTGSTKTSNAAGAGGTATGGQTSGAGGTTLGGRGGAPTTSSGGAGQAGSIASGGVSSKAGAGVASTSSLGGQTQIGGGSSAGTTTASSSTSSTGQGGSSSSTSGAAGGSSQVSSSTAKAGGSSGCSCELGRSAQSLNGLAGILLCLGLLALRRSRCP
jgi:arabinoxylan arabinofuranohydrolase